MDVRIETDARGRFICTLTDGETETVVTTSDAPSAGRALLDAIASVADAGVGECTWAEPGGEYRWLFKREADQLAVVVLWSSGTLTGWQHVFRTEAEAGPLLARLRAELAIHGITAE
jgi:hypothetical protein